MKHFRPKAFLRLVLLIGSLWALRRELAGLGPAALLHRLGGYGWIHVTLGLAATALSFLLLGVLELVTLRSSETSSGRVSHGTAFGTAFIANAFSQSIGLALLTGTAVRIRAYRRHGLDTAAVARVSALVTVSTVLGLLSIGSWALVATSSPVTVGPYQLAERPLGALLGVIVLAYVVWTIRARVDTATPPWSRVPRPTPFVALTQVAVSAADWLVTGAVLYVFLPADSRAGIWPFLAAYAIAQMVAMVSHVPAGAGVFELVLVGLLTAGAPTASRAGMLAAIIMFRALYYLLPLCVAILLAAGAELRRSRRRKLDRDAPSAAVLVGAQAPHHA
jgi:phosphatidylglycerol lysyltransferase